MGAQLSLLAQTAPSIAISSYIDVLDEVHYQSQLNSSRFLKTCKALDPNGEIVVKIFLKPTESYELSDVYSKIQKQSVILRQLPHVLNYSKIVYTDRAGYLIRQHLKTNLYDRLSLRPFLQDIELKFLSFQLLQLLSDIHMRDVCHGDIKTENIMVTSANWLILTDFAEYLKPKYLPEDNPGEYAFYFDTSRRRTCYVAPERFNTRLYTTESDNKLEKEMDIFSAGCCIFELFTEGRALFNLSQLFKYKNGEIDAIETVKNEIKDINVQNLILDMIALKPNERLSARNLLMKYKSSLFPESFYSFLYEYFRNLTLPNEGISGANKTSLTSTLEERKYELDTIVDKIYKDFPKICTASEYPLRPFEDTNKDDDKFVKHSVRMEGLGCIKLKKFKEMSSESVRNESALLFLSILLHCLRNLLYPKNKQKCLEMVLALSQYVSDSNKLDRVLPFVCCMLFDEFPNIKGLSIQILSQLLHLVDTVDHSNANIFIDYVMPRLNKLCQNPTTDGYVRMILAASLSELASSATKFHELSYVLRCQESNIAEINQLQKAKRKLLRQFQNITTYLLTASEPYVKEALLDNILPICNLFGREKTNDIILSHLITYLNDKNSSLRIALMRSITGVSILLGPVALEQYILPLLTQTLTDSEELVVVNVLESLICFCKVGLLKIKYFYDITSEVSPLILHPNLWIRQFTMLLIIEMSSHLSKSELYCLMYPIMKPFFQFDVELTWESMSIGCKKPISRNVYNLLCTWSLRSSKSFFWKQLPSKNLNSFGNNTIQFITKSFTAKNYGFQTSLKPSKSHVTSIKNEEIPLTTEDKNWIDKIKTVGLSETELWKLATLRIYVFRVAKMISRRPEAELSDGENVMNEKTRYGLPRNVFFEIELLNPNRVRDTHIVLTQQIPKDIHNNKQNVSHILQRPIDMNGSLILTPKSHPITNSSFENVYVQFEPTTSPMSSNNSSTSKQTSESKFRITHTYDGQYKTVREYLENITIEPSLRSFKEFGEQFSGSQRSFDISQTQNLYFQSSLSDHKPATIVKLVGNEHKSYAVSGSDDGYLKIWDLVKIENGSTFKPEINYELGSSITYISFIPDYDDFIVSTTDGSIILFRVIFKNYKTTVLEIDDIEIIRKFNYSNAKQYAITLSYSNDHSQPHVITTTNIGEIVIIDIRNMSVICSIDSSPIYGSIISSSVSADGFWLLCGTLHGVLLFWNLQFKVLVKTWTFGDGSPIRKVSLYKKLSKKSEYNAIIVGGYNKCFFTIWNLSRLQIEEVIALGGMNPSIDALISKPFTFSPNMNVRTDILSGNYVSDLIYQDNNIFYSDGLTSEIYKYNLSTRSNTALLSDKNYDKSGTTKITVNCSLTIVEESSERKIQDRPTFFNTDLINSISLGIANSGPVLLSGDNSGMIHIYSVNHI